MLENLSLLFRLLLCYLPNRKGIFFKYLTEVCWLTHAHLRQCGHSRLEHANATPLIGVQLLAVAESCCPINLWLQINEPDHITHIYRTIPKSGLCDTIFNENHD